jgi:hypothetical protein
MCMRMRVHIVVLAMFLLACAGDDDTSKSGDPCVGGICNGSDGGGVSSGSGGGGAGTPTCAWQCTPWETDGVSDGATRSCVDVDGCAAADGKPIETVTLPTLDFNFFKCNVEPVFDQKCSQLACHGVEPAPPPGRALRVYHRARLRASGEAWPAGGMCAAYQVSQDCIGSNECQCRDQHTQLEWQRNYDSARGFALYPDGSVIPATELDQSELLLQPVIAGGPAHAGMKMYRTTDADYQIILEWLGGATLAICNTTN